MPRFSPHRHVRGTALSLLTAAIALIGFSPPAAAQQTGQVVVTVVNGQTGSPLANAQVSVVGTQLGSTTNTDGRLILAQVPVGQREIRVDYIGFATNSDTVNVTAGEAVNLRIELFTRAVELEGLVVTGTAIAAQQREIGNSIALITAEQIETAGAANFEDILRGRALGLSVMGSPGQVGAGGDILLRGVNSVNNLNQPLIYIDGVRMPSGLPEGNTGGANPSEQATFLGSLNPSDIERIEIIKGPAASTLYGTEASSGVIQIFTKRGQEGPPRWTLNMEQGISRIGHVGPDMDPTGMHVNDCTRQFIFNTETMQYEIDNTPDPGCPDSGSWLKTGHSQNYQLSVRGGSPTTSYYISGGASKQTGVIELADQGQTQMSLRGNLTFDGFPNLRISLNNMYSRRDITWFPNGDSDQGLLFNVARGAEGDTPNNDDREVLVVDLDQFINHFNTGANLNWTPRDNFRHRLNLGLDFSNSHFITNEPWMYFDNPEGSRAVDIENQRVMTVDYAGSWQMNLSSDFRSTTSWGGQYNQREHLGLRGDSDEFFGPGAKILQNGSEFFNQEDKTVTESYGFFLEEQVGWRNRFFITGGFRADTHSAFGEDYTLNQEYTIYPRVNAAYTISDHDFWPDFWETFRIRSAYGVSGQPPRPRDPLTLFQVAGAGEDQLGYIIINQGNRNIGPELSREFEYGADGSLLGGRLSYQFTGYKRKTFDGHISINPPPSNGIAENVRFNVGEWKSKGYEAKLDVVAYEGDNVRASVNGSYQFNETEMVDLGSREFEEFNYNYLNSYRAGFPLPSLFGRELLNRGAVGELPEYGEDTRYWFGPTRPPHEASVGASVTLFNRLTVDGFGVAQFGQWIYDDLAQEMAEDQLWPPCMEIDARVQAGDYADIPTLWIARCAEPYASDNINDNQDWAEKGDYFRMQSMNVSYRVPERWLPAGSNATVRLQATNLFLITNFSGLDPDALINPGAQTARGGGYILPTPRTYSLNIRVTF